ncbi:hypothetical protein N7533_007503 [Penicillium manginii]|uniref:uncharacterized protein n=1 Tax=Penicillium manginii TaxID=203109 RepID=UPI002548B9AA|nr:uncharacterized protein N7533_007503 [Penicillium manginii]KAJ5750475.1 hypothetical protein N7533_007503 [Penicillium manginii]
MEVLPADKEQRQRWSPQSYLCPPYDPEIIAVDDTQHRPVPRGFDELKEIRKGEEDCSQEFFDDPDLTINDHIIPISERYLTAISLSLRQPSDAKKARPGILFFHGGGRVMGNVFTGLNSLTEAVKRLDAIVISINYPLSPDYPGMDVVEDCYKSLAWLSQHLDVFRINPRQFMISGVSAGAGLAAGTVLIARDRKGPQVCAQLLMCPMLDDRCNTLSCLQFENGRGFYTTWDRYAWSCILGCEAGQDGVSPYVAPARATDLSGLPIAYIDAASGEPFRDEDIAYATKLWECGVQAHLHIWGGGCHGFDLFYKSQLGRQACATRTKWLIEFLQSQR